MSAAPGQIIAAGILGSDTCDLQCSGPSLASPPPQTGIETVTQNNITPGSDPTGLNLSDHVGPILHVSALLTTSAAVALRTPVLIWDNGVFNMMTAPASATLAAGLSAVFVWSLAPIATVAAATQIWSPLGSTALAGNTSVIITTTNLQAGDQWTEIRWVVALHT